MPNEKNCHKSAIDGGLRDFRKMQALPFWQVRCSLHNLILKRRYTMRTFDVRGIPIFVDTRVANPRLWELRGITEIPAARVILLPPADEPFGELFDMLAAGATLQDILGVPGMPGFLAVTDSANEYVPIVIPAEAGIQPNDVNPHYWIPAFAGMTETDLHRNDDVLANLQADWCPDTGLLARSPNVDLTHLDLTGEDITLFMSSDAVGLMQLTGFTYHDLFEADTITGMPNSLILTDGMDFITIIDEGSLMPGWCFDAKTGLFCYLCNSVPNPCCNVAAPYRSDDGLWWILCKDCNEGKIYDRGEVVDVSASAIVTLTDNSRNILTVTVVEEYCDETFGSFERVFSVNNNAMATFDVGGYSIFVDTRVSNQALMRLRNITEFEATRVVIMHNNY